MKFAEITSMDSAARSPLNKHVCRIGVFGMTNADDVMLAPLDAWLRRTHSASLIQRIVLGEEIRDWNLQPGDCAFFPYDSDAHLISLPEGTLFHRWLWPARTTIGNRATFAGRTYFDEGRPWYEWHQLPEDKSAHHWTITFAFVATHNHFVLARGGKVFKQTSPVIKLTREAGEDDHIGPLGLLNSSTGCFWLKQVCYDRGNGGIGGGIASEDWERFYEFTGTKLEDFPLPSELPLMFGRILDGLGQRLAELEPPAVCAAGAPDRAGLMAAREEYSTSGSVGGWWRYRRSWTGRLTGCTGG
jgi:hypothetical protein